MNIVDKRFKEGDCVVVARGSSPSGLVIGGIVGQPAVISEEALVPMAFIGGVQSWVVSIRLTGEQWTGERDITSIPEDVLDPCPDN